MQSGGAGGRGVGGEESGGAGGMASGTTATATGKMLMRKQSNMAGPAAGRAAPMAVPAPPAR
jgi:hypothetical protein